MPIVPVSPVRLHSSGGRTRTSDYSLMRGAFYRLNYTAMWHRW